MPKKKRQRRDTRSPEEQAETLYAVNPEECKHLAHEYFISGCDGFWEYIYELGIPHGTCQNWIHGQKASSTQPWKEERAQIESEIVEGIKAKKKEQFEQIIKLTGNQLLRGLKKLEVREEAPSMSDLPKLAKVLTDVHKHLQLELGKPTEISGRIKEGKQTIRQLFEELQKIDPDVDYSTMLEEEMIEQ